MRTRVLFLGVFVATAALAREAHADPKACIAASERGQSLRNDGKLGAAKAAFTECAADACPGAIRKECGGWLGEVEAAMPTVVFGAKLGTTDVTGVRVTMDGTKLVDSLDGRPVAIDPGSHVFRFEIEGQPVVEKTVLVKQGEKNRSIDATFGSVGVVGVAVVGGPPPMDATGGATATVTVQVDEGSEPVLEKKRSNTWAQVCTGACNREVPIDGIYRINGSGVRTTQGFSLDARGGEHVLVGVEPGTNHGRTAGLVLLGTGGVLAVVGGVLLGIGAANPHCDNVLSNGGCTSHSANPLVPVGVVGIGVGVVLAVIGAAVLATGHSDAFQKKTAALLGAGAAGLAF